MGMPAFTVEAPLRAKGRLRLVEGGRTQSDTVHRVYRVLVVEDDEFEARIIKRDLERAAPGMQVRITHGFETGIEAACSGEYDAALVDYRLGPATGIQLIERCRGAGVRIPMILLTGQGNLELDRDAMRRGASDYLNKNEMSPALLERAIRNAVERESALAQLIASKRRYEAVVEGSNDGTWDWNLRTDEFYLSPRFKSMLGFDDASMKSCRRAWLDRVHPKDQQRLQQAIEAHTGGRTETLAVEYRVRHRDGQWVWMHLRGLATRDANGEVERLAGCQSDISQRKVAEERARHLSMHDPLTGLANRVLLGERIGQELERVRRDSRRAFTVLYLDLDRFKPINDQLGHAAGDQVLVTVAQRVRDTVRGVDAVARVGGDEFVVVLEECGSPADALIVAAKLEAAVSEPIALEGQSVSVGVSIGAKVVVDASVDAEGILDAADTAMYAKKQRSDGGEAYRLTVANPLPSSLCRDLRAALAAGDVRPHFQPVVDAQDATVLAYEALARWAHPTRGEVAPAEFVTVAAREGLGVELGRSMLEQACRWAAARTPEAVGSVSVNLCHEHVESPSLVEDVESALRLSGLAPQRLRLEISERAPLLHMEPTIRNLSTLVERGVGVVIDDFGSGSASLDLLFNVRCVAVKFDRSLITSLRGDARKTAVARRFVELAHSLGTSATAEGVETQIDWDTVRAIGVDRCQGFLFGRPSPHEQGADSSR